MKDIFKDIYNFDLNELLKINKPIKDLYIYHNNQLYSLNDVNIDMRKKYNILNHFQSHFFEDKKNLYDIDIDKLNNYYNEIINQSYDNYYKDIKELNSNYSSNTINVKNFIDFLTSKFHDVKVETEQFKEKSITMKQKFDEVTKNNPNMKFHKLLTNSKFIQISQTGTKFLEQMFILHQVFNKAKITLGKYQLDADTNFSNLEEEIKKVQTNSFFDKNTKSIFKKLNKNELPSLNRWEYFIINDDVSDIIKKVFTILISNIWLKEIERKISFFNMISSQWNSEVMFHQVINYRDSHFYFLNYIRDSDNLQINKVDENYYIILTKNNKEIERFKLSKLNTTSNYSISLKTFDEEFFVLSENYKSENICVYDGSQNYNLNEINSTDNVIFSIKLKINLDTTLMTKSTSVLSEQGIVKKGKKNFKQRPQRNTSPHMRRVNKDEKEEFMSEYKQTKQPNKDSPPSISRGTGSTRKPDKSKIIPIEPNITGPNFYRKSDIVTNSVEPNITDPNFHRKLDIVTNSIDSSNSSIIILYLKNNFHQDLKHFYIDYKKEAKIVFESMPYLIPYRIRLSFNSILNEQKKIYI